MEREAWMKRHIMIHLGDKPFKCQFCTYSGAQKVQLWLAINLSTIIPTTSLEKKSAKSRVFTTDPLKNSNGKY